MATIEAEKNFYQNFGVGTAEEVARSYRVEVLNEIAGEVAMLLVCTGNPQKVENYVKMMSYFSGRQMRSGEVVVWSRDTYQEPKFVDPVAVAESKVNQARLNPSERGKYGIPENYAAIAGDINAFAQNRDGELTILHQLSRLNRALTPEEVGLVRQMLIRRYHDLPKENGHGKILYETGTYIRNGREAGFGDKIEITYGPIDIELLDRYFAQAVESGLIMCSNMQMAAIECLIESEAILSISILPRELELKGYTLKNLRRAPTPALLLKILETVLTNIPIHSY
jgi:hypothetical protein